MTLQSIYEADGSPKKYPLHQPIWDHGYDWEHWMLIPAGTFHGLLWRVRAGLSALLGLAPEVPALGLVERWPKALVAFVGAPISRSLVEFLVFSGGVWGLFGVVLGLFGLPLWRPNSPPPGGRIFALW